MEGTRMLIQVRTDCLITYNSTEYRMSLSPIQLKKMKEAAAAARLTKYSGLFTQGARKRIGRAIDLLVQIAVPKYGVNEVTKKRQKHMLSFITLTIPPIELLTAERGYNKLLSHFLQWLRRTKKVNTYVWKAEFQKNKQLHYHITTPSWIHYQEIKDKWNNLLRASGLLDDYYKNKGHYGANSTDVHEVKNINNLAGYLKKEFCKEVQNMQSTGKLWDCSLNLKDNKYFTMELTSVLLKKLDQDIELGKIQRIELDQCNIYKAVRKNKIQEVLDLEQIQKYMEYIAHVTNYSRQELTKRRCKN
jgi:hypothetical protein